MSIEKRKFQTLLARLPAKDTWAKRKTGDKRIMKKIIAIIAMAIAASAFAQQTNTVEVYRQAYEKQQKTYSAQYGTALDNTIEDLRMKGDLDNILILQAEKKRFATENTVPAPKDAKDAFRQSSEAYYQSMVVLLEKYVRVLDGLIKTEVTANRIEKAKSVKTEKDKAAFKLTDMQTHLPANTLPSNGASLPGKKTGTAMISPALPGNLLRGCILFYSFDKDKGDEIKDNSGRGNNGVLKGASLVASTDETTTLACEFGPGASIDTDSGKDSTSEFRELTLLAWVKPASANDEQHIVGRTAGNTTFQTPGSFGLVLEHEPPLFPCFHFNDGADQRFSFAKKIGTNKWYHLAAVLKANGSVAGYTDGARALSKSGCKHIPTLPNAFFRIGRWDSGSYPYNLNGLADDVMIYNRALSDSEIKQIFNAQKSQH